MASQSTHDVPTVSIVIAAEQGKDVFRDQHIQQPEQERQMADSLALIVMDENVSDGTSGPEQGQGLEDGVGVGVDIEYAKACIDFTLRQQSEGRCLSGHFLDRVEYNHESYLWHVRKRRGIFSRKKKDHKNCSSCIASFSNSGILWKEFVQAERDWKNRRDILETYIAHVKRLPQPQPQPQPHPVDGDGQTLTSEREGGAEEALEVCRKSLEEYGSCREPLCDILDTLGRELSPRALETAKEMIVEQTQR
ncbi:hypothetical protein RBB50_008213 [Rhinocladiella similis]